MSLQAFSWNESDVSRKFQSCGDNIGFVDVWNCSIVPFLQADGCFTSSLASSPANHDQPGASSSENDYTPQRKGGKGKRLSETPPVLLPASKSARMALKMDAEDLPDDAQMDKEIQKHFIGELL